MARSRRASDLGALDQAAIDQVRKEAWPEPRDAEEMHDSLLLHNCLMETDAADAGWGPWLDELREAGRATRFISGACLLDGRRTLAFAPRRMAERPRGNGGRRSRAPSP